MNSAHKHIRPHSSCHRHYIQFPTHQSWSVFLADDEDLYYYKMYLTADHALPCAICAMGLKQGNRGIEML